MPAIWSMVVCIFAVVAQATVFWGYWRVGRDGSAPVPRKVAIPIQIFGGLTLLGSVVWVILSTVELWGFGLSRDALVVFIWPLLFQVVAIPFLFNRPRLLLIWCVGVQSGFWAGAWTISMIMAHRTHTSDLGGVIGEFALAMVTLGLITLGVILGPLVLLPLGWLWTRRAEARDNT